MQWIRIQLSQKKKRKATGQHGKQKDRGRPPGGRRTAPSKKKQGNKLQNTKISSECEIF